MALSMERPELGRRDMMTAFGALGLAALAGRASAAPRGFTPTDVDRLARELARKPYAPPITTLPPELAGLDYDAYRAHRFDRTHAFWAGSASGIIGEPMLRGWLFRERIELFDVRGGRAEPIAYEPGRFSFPPQVAATDRMAGFSGLRFLAPLNRPDVRDEIAVFQGASYFRSLGKGQLYGISARGLALGTGGPAEEFPVFRAFWLEEPSGEGTLRLHALLDGPSIAGAYHIDISPGATTVFDIDARVYPRTLVGAPGVAPMSSMFLLGPGSPRRFDDFRRAVHDSDGIEMWTGAGERLWRPLANPTAARVSAFADDSPRGFGLMQRAQRFSDYGDLEARYERRPSLWVEPLDRWGPGTVQLVELPTADETHDNVATFWRPARPWTAGSEVRLRYRLHWGAASAAPADVARVIATRVGAAVVGDRTSSARHFAVDFEGGSRLGDESGLRAALATTAGAVSPVRIERLPDDGGIRVSFELAPPPAGVAELRLTLERDGRAVSETWVNRWAV